MIYDPTQIILNVTVREILYEVPTDEEIDSVAKYLESPNKSLAFEKYILPLVEIHSEEWVEKVAKAILKVIQSEC